jgi:hypothetical protein
MFQWLSAISITAHRMSGPKIGTGMKLSRSIALHILGMSKANGREDRRPVDPRQFARDVLNGVVLTLSASLFTCLLLWTMARRSMDEEGDVHLRSGEGEMIEIDDEGYAMDLGSGIEEHNGLDMDREEDEDVEMDPQEIQTRKRTRSQLDMGYRSVKDEEGPLKKKTKQEGDVMDIVGEMALFATP